MDARSRLPTPCGRPIRRRTSSVRDSISDEGDLFPGPGTLTCDQGSPFSTRACPCPYPRQRTMPSHGLQANAIRSDHPYRRSLLSRTSRCRSAPCPWGRVNAHGTPDVGRRQPARRLLPCRFWPFRAAGIGLPFDHHDSTVQDPTGGVKGVGGGGGASQKSAPFFMGTPLILMCTSFPCPGAFRRRP